MVSVGRRFLGPITSPNTVVPTFLSLWSSIPRKFITSRCKCSFLVRSRDGRLFGKYSTALIIISIFLCSVQLGGNGSAISLHVNLSPCVARLFIAGLTDTHYMPRSPLMLMFLLWSLLLPLPRHFASIHCRCSSSCPFPANCPCSYPYLHHSL